MRFLNRRSHRNSGVRSGTRNGFNRPLDIGQRQIRTAENTDEHRIRLAQDFSAVEQWIFHQGLDCVPTFILAGCRPKTEDSITVLGAQRGP